MGWTAESSEYLAHSDEDMVVELASRRIAEGIGEMQRLGAESGDAEALLCRVCGYRWQEEDGIRCGNCGELIGAGGGQSTQEEPATPLLGGEREIAAAVEELAAETMTRGQPQVIP